MLRKSPVKLFIVLLLLLSGTRASSQLTITSAPDAMALVQKLVGDGVSISNVSFSGNLVMAGFFNNFGGTQLNIDSGIVLTNGRAFARPPQLGLVGTSGQNADNILGLPGDPQLSAEVSGNTNDACVLEFDFIPLGDSIRFNYVFSSEEYRTYVCQFNDAFAFFISGPGIAGSQNIALIPRTIYPVTIDHIQDVGACPGKPFFPQYYVHNDPNSFFTHNGHTTVLTAESEVTPCETYHLKLVIADVGDFAFDSGVFLEAKSLSSNVISMANNTQTDPAGGSYLVEGCIPGSFDVSRPRKDPTPMIVQLSYGGSAVNGVDYTLLPTNVTIPANDSFVTVNLTPIVDGLPEGVEQIIVYALGGCASGLPTDSTIIEIRDYDTLTVSPGSGFLCRNNSVQLDASGSYTTYQWNPDPTLSNINIRNPIATPVVTPVTYIVTGTQGTCNARDSITFVGKAMEYVSQVDVNCRAGTTGSITVNAGPEWIAPIEYSIDGINWQSSGTFNNLPIGTHRIRTRDAGCIDSLDITLIQAFPDLVISSLTATNATCTGGADGTVTITATGGNGTYTYSSDGVNFQPSNVFNLAGGTYTITVKDGNGCTESQTVVVDVINTVTVDASLDKDICEGTSYLIPATTNATSVEWTPSTNLSSTTILTPIASPTVTTKYYITATEGICTRTDSITITILPAPIANAGADITVCNGKTVQFNGSGGVSYQWSPTTNFISAGNIADPSVKARETLTYYLTVTDALGCSSVVPDDLTLTVTPAVKIFAGRDTVAAINQPIQLNVRELGTAGVTSYVWTPATYLSNPAIADPIATLPFDFHYFVTGTTPDGCEGMDDIIIKVYKGPDIYVPSGFTPDNNGKNDVLRAIPVGIKEFRFFRVFNRWGQVIFSTQDPTRGWDGRINGIEQSTGTYVWVAEAIDFTGKQINRKGVVTIIR